MTTNEPGWDLYRSFLAVMREGSLSAAARALGMTQPSLGRHMRQLETELGVALFARSPQGLAPTENAHELVPHAQAMAAASAALRRVASASNHEIRGVVRLTCSEVVGAEVLPPMLAAFRRQHPGIVIELSLSNQSEDLLRKDADIAVRMLRPAQTALVARRIGGIPLGLHAHRSYLKTYGRPLTVADLQQHALIGFDRETPALRALRSRLPFSREDFALRTDNDLAQLAAIRAGFGIGVCQCPIARRDRELVHLLPDAFALELDTWLVMHEDLRASRRVRLLYDYLVQALGAYVGGQA
ncbi:LysR family transcriptional regulator [Rhodanobacter glycinis]|uniref:LysR family transcriptional regulator n=1 Tax=Rhodanobacter glycinis TaxID=582702 RepID=A0A502C4R6_9GAMM|nr:LysR family transcriptional regulator [Rhodanobacter glycinis]TPG08545.1 LysR family transcriptional regulator [Rhodanobacter glycinis]TPG47741.1 LysR family transcriptional regulator [Rhodanobacter glycinis]